MKKILLHLLLLLPTLMIAQEDAYLGIYSNHVSEEKAAILNFDNPNGAYITRVLDNTSAKKNGLQVFDYLYAMNDLPFTEERDFSDAMDEFKEGDQVKFSFVRNGQKMEKMISLGKKSDAKYPSHDDDKDPFLGVAQMHMDLPKGMNGVPVRIVNCSTAEEMGLQKEDIITNIDDTPIIDWHDLTAGIDNRQVGEPIKVSFYRDGQTYEAELPIKSSEATHDCDDEDEEEMESTATETVEPIAEAIEERSTIEEDMEDMEIVMEDVSEAEAEDMKNEKGIDMPIVNNLAIERLNIFPNPTAGAFEVRFELPEAGRTTIRIFNSAASLIYQNDLGQFSGDFSDRIDISERGRGTYFVEIRQDGKSLSKKLILQ